ncbi:glycogen debranching protein GlgX [Kineobactrum salinum]|uniref:Glycogen debranching protein GlgX n=1 Tax=Kineobactrum salinum TaxID=2708301 RepID=A0A6C0U2J1_9GAMM|nr:glycogen debranching protein GlgX [Kineobactrum salinum]QIB65197.1 glycogen debranching protein GlgX [Kineobactrum salinum]
MKIVAGEPRPLGATWTGDGVNFALFSAHAEAVELCLYDPSGLHEVARLMLPDKTHDVWHGFVPRLQPGYCYGYRVHGPYEPRAGHRFNPHKLLLDPYATRLLGRYRWDEANFGYARSDEALDLVPDARDNAVFVPKGVVSAASEWCNNAISPLVPWRQTVIYETHVRGFTMRHPQLPEALRGRFAGLAQPQLIDYLKALGITTVELLPVHAFIDEYHLHEKGLGNYWGYNTLSFFAPHPDYLVDGEVDEFRQMVDRLHEAGLEVILDVVFNHSCEGNHLGPTLSFRGIDNLSYYQLMPGDRRFYVNDSGCGNTLNLGHPRVMQLVMDSLRYWAGYMGVDGFRFDLATVLGRTEQGFDSAATFFQVVAQDPLLASCKLIAEPWDIGPGGYQLGHFPANWSEWNDRYRDTVRRFWRGDQGQLPELARRLHGSGDIFEHAGRRPSASINFITSHDGFPLRDLVSYRQRHNEANGEDNNDGHRENLSSNFGVEGPTDDPAIDALRWQMQRNFLATLAVSQGVPMLLAGDERGRSQQGNNNAYCQDNALNWLDWEAAGEQPQLLLAFTRKLLALRRQFPVLQADVYRHRPDHPRDDGIQWLNGDGLVMREEHWHEHLNQLLGYLLTDTSGAADGPPRYLLVIFNAAAERYHFTLPATPAGSWQLLADTARPAIGEASRESYEARTTLELAAHSVQILNNSGAAAPATVKRSPWSEPEHTLS